MCRLTPPKCPFPGCTYKGFNRCWSGHFISRHKLFPKKFKYDRSFKMSLPTTEQFVNLLGPDGQLFLLLNKNDEPTGYALSVVCICGGVMKCKCQNGHVACSSCWSQLRNKCHICSREVSRSRNIFLEKIIESIKVSCSYTKWGCPENISYAKRPAHEEKCIFAPSKCPFPGCTYKRFNRCWSGHFISRHKLFPKKFKYDRSFKMSLPTTEQFVNLLGPDGQLFLLLNKNDEPTGYALSVVCICGGVMKCKFSYELAVTTSNGSSLQLKASVTDVREWNGIYPTNAFLLVPSEFARSASGIEVDVSVCKM